MNNVRKRLIERVTALEKATAAKARIKPQKLSEAEIGAFIDLFPSATPITYADWIAEHPEHADVAETVFDELAEWQPDIYLKGHHA